MVERAFPIFIIRPVDILARLGESALFNCDCGNSEKISWSAVNVDGQSLNRGIDYDKLQNNSLYIRSVSSKHEGNYTCECSNYVNQTSLTVQLKFPCK